MHKPNQQMQAILDAHAELGPLPIESMTCEHARAMPLLDRAALAVYGHHFTKRAITPMPLPVGRVQHRTISGAAGDLLVRIYTPKGSEPLQGWPVLVYYPGGGWVLAGLDTYDASCRGLCDGADCMVISVYYRHAPEHRWPAASDDALAAFLWVQRNASELGGDPTRMAIAGESAGGNLAAVVAQKLRDAGNPAPLHQLLIYPVTDVAEGPSRASAEENADAKPLNRAMLHWFYNHYVPDEADRRDPAISPLYGNLRGLPPATLILAEIDPLRSEGEAYAKRMLDAGVSVDLHVYKGVTHDFFSLTGLVEEAAEALATACRHLRRSFRNEQGALQRVLEKAG